MEPSEDNIAQGVLRPPGGIVQLGTFSGEDVDEADSALTACAERIAVTYHDHRDRTYRAESGHEHPRRGAATTTRNS